MKRICSLLILLALWACGQQNIMSEEEYLENIKQLGWDLPDSLKTPEQIAMMEKYITVTLSNTVVKNNQMYLKAKRKDYVEQGLPEICYDLTLHQYYNNNKVFKELENTDVGKTLDISEALEDAKKEYLNK